MIRSPIGARLPMIRRACVERNRRWISVLVCAPIVLSAIAAGPLLAADDDAVEPPRQAAIVVVGAEGTAQYGRLFRDWADRWLNATQQGNVDCQIIGLDNAADNSQEQLQQAIEEFSQPSDEPLWIVFIGHGTFDGRRAKFNLQGPDITAEQLKAWIDQLQRPVAIVNCASSSGPFLTSLAGPNRIVLTSTRSGFEQNFARFGEYLSAAIADPNADLDKDHQTSLLEAYLVAVARTNEFYTQQGRLVTEHALLDDNGDGKGTPADWFRGVRPTKTPTEDAAVDGALANQWHLVRSPQEQQLSPEQRARRNELETSIENLRRRKTELEAEQYYAELETLCLELARIYAPQDD